MRTLSFTVGFLVWVAVGQLSWSQIPYRSYAPPAGPTLPYQLDYFRPQSGVLDQYNQFVAPKEALAGQLRGLAQQQNYDYHAMEKQLRESDQIRESKAASTGTAAGFMNFSHYFGQRSASRSAPARRSSTQYTPSQSTMPNLGFGT